MDWVRNEVKGTEGLSSCPSWTSNHDIANVLLLQRHVSPWVGNPAEKDCVCSSCPPSLWCRSGCVSVPTRETVWCGAPGRAAFPFLPNWKEMYFLASSSTGHLHYWSLLAVGIFKYYSCSLKEAQESMSRIRSEFCFIATELPLKKLFPTVSLS